MNVCAIQHLCATFAYSGPHCEQVGILYVTLLSSRNLRKELSGTKGVLSELNDFRKENDIAWDIFHQWIVHLKGEDDINLESLKVSLFRLDKKRAELKRKQAKFFFTTMSCDRMWEIYL